MPPAVVGTVFPGHPADGKLLPGDRVVAINGHEVQTFYALTREVEHSAGKRLSLTVQRGDMRKRVTVVPAATRRERPLDLVDYVGRVGITPAQPAAVLGVMSPKAPAAVAQLKTFDVVIAAGGEPVRHFADVQKAFASNTGSLVPLTYLRPTRVTAALGGLVDMDIYEPHLAAVTPEPGAGTPDERGGIELADLYVNEVTVGSPEHRIGLRPGDRLLTLDGEPIRLWATFLGELREGRGRLHSLSWRRAGAVHSGHFRLRHERGITEHGQPYDRYVVGIRNWLPASVEPPVPNPHPLSYAVVEAFRSTKEVVELTLFSVVRLLQGRLSVKSIGGPLTIFEVAGTAAREGALNYLTLMAFISINLGLINLLPIPMLDGGHLLFFVVEAVARRPLSVRIREYASIAGLSLLIALMILAFKNDIERQWPRIVDEVSGD